MTQSVDYQEMDKLLADIASIKSVLNNNRPLLKQLLLPVHFRIIALISGLVIIGGSTVYYLLLSYYGQHELIPNAYRVAGLVILIVTLLVLGFLKRLLWVKSVKRYDHGFTFGLLIKNLYSYQFMHIWTPVSLVIIFICIYLAVRGAYQYIVPAASFGMGFLYNSLGSVARIRQYLITGYWLLLTGIPPLFFLETSPLLFLSISQGCGMLLFALISGNPREAVLEDEERG